MVIKDLKGYFNLHLDVPGNGQARIQRGCVHPPPFAPNSLKSPLSRPKKSWERAPKATPPPPFSNPGSAFDGLDCISEHVIPPAGSQAPLRGSTSLGGFWSPPVILLSPPTSFQMENLGYILSKQQLLVNLTLCGLYT